MVSLSFPHARGSLPSSALHALSEHAAVLGVEVGGVVADGRCVVEGAVGGRWAHSVAVRRRGPAEERSETAASR